MTVLCLAFDRLFGGGRYSMDHPVLEQIFAQRLPARGHRVICLFHDRELRIRTSVRRWHGADVFLLPSAGAVPGARWINAGVRRHRLRAIVQCLLGIECIDVVQIRNDWEAALLLAGPLAERGIPLVFQWSFPHELVAMARLANGTSGPVAKAERESARIRDGSRRAMRAAAHVLPVSQWMRDALVAEGLSESRMTPWPLGADPATFSAGGSMRAAVRRELDLGERPVAIYFGEMGELRRLDFLLDAFVVARRVVQDAVLLMVGTGDHPDDVARLKRAAVARGLGGSVRFTGYLPRHQMPGLIAAADVGVSPIPPIPLYEISSPTKLVEMLAAGCPVVANDIPEQRLLLTESGGGRLVPYDHGAFGEAIGMLLADPDGSRRMGAKGRTWASQHRSIDALTVTLLQVYERVTGLV